MKKIYSLLFFIVYAICITPPAFTQTTTPNLGLVLPTAVPGTWAEDINENFQKIDDAMPGGVAGTAFGGLTSSTNTTATMTVGTGASIVPSGNGIIDATRIKGVNVSGTAPTDTQVLCYDQALTSWKPCTDQTGGAPPFSAITSATNTTATLTVGTGASIVPSGSGVISATTLSANPADCAAGQGARGITATGAAENCVDFTEEPGTTGIVAKTAANTTAGRTLQPHTNVLTWTNGDGVAGNPTPVVATPLIDGSIRHCNANSGTDAYACNLTTAPSGYANGAVYGIMADVANTGIATANFNGLGAKTIKKVTGGITTDLSDNDIRAGQIVWLTYKQSNDTFQIQSTLGNAGSGSGTVSGTTGTLAKFTSSTVVGDSGLVEDADSFNFTKKLEVGDVSTNSLTFDTSAVTGAKTVTWQNASGTVSLFGSLVDTAEVTAALKTKSITFMIGSETGSALADTDDQPTVWRNNIGSMTISEVWAESDAGSPVINLQRDDGTPANILSSNLTVSSSGVVGSIAGAESVLALGDRIDFVLVSGASGAKRITVQIKASLD